MQVCQAAVQDVHQELGDENYMSANLRVDSPAIPMLDTLGDDTVPLRSGAASEPLSKMLAGRPLLLRGGRAPHDCWARISACETWWWAC